MNVNVDLSAFNKLLAEDIKGSSRSMEKVINGQAYALALAAIKHTKRADATRIDHVLGRVGTKLTINKGGEFRKTKSGRVSGRTAIYKDDSLAARIINARLRDKKKRDKNVQLLFGSDLDAAVKKFVGSRKRSSGFIASGWKWAVNDLAVRVGYEDRQGKSSGPKPKGKRMGYALLAKAGSHKPFARIRNTAFGTRSKSTGIAVAEEGMAKAIAEVSAKIKAHIEKRVLRQLRRK